MAIVTNINGKDFLPIIEEGNEYYYHMWDDGWHCYYTLKLEGDSLHNGKIYKICKWNIKGINSDTGEESYKSFTNGLVREENGKVWMLYDILRENSWLPYYYGSTSIETLIYNMNLEVEEDLEVITDQIDEKDFFCFENIFWYRRGKFRLLEKKLKTINNEERLVQKFASQYRDDQVNWFPIEVIEGIGAFNHLLIFPYSKNELAGNRTGLAQLLEKKILGVKWNTNLNGTPTRQRYKIIKQILLEATAK